MAFFIPANSRHLWQLSSIHWCIYASLMSPLPLKGASPCTWSHLRLTLIVRAAHSWVHHLSVLSVLCELSGSTSLCVPSVAHLHSMSSVWGLPYPSQSHLNPSHSPPMSQYSYRALCISHLHDQRCHYSSRSWPATLSYPNIGTLIKQLLHLLFSNSTFYPSDGSWDAGHITPFRTGDMELATRT